MWFICCCLRLDRSRGLFVNNGAFLNINWPRETNVKKWLCLHLLSIQQNCSTNYWLQIYNLFYALGSASAVASASSATQFGYRNIWFTDIQSIFTDIQSIQSFSADWWTFFEFSHLINDTTVRFFFKYCGIIHLTLSNMLIELLIINISDNVKCIIPQYLKKNLTVMSLIKCD